VTVAIVTVAGLALASGCASKKHTSACYSPPPATAYAPPPEPAPAPKEAAQTSQGSIVVPLQQETFTVGKREVDAGSVRLKKIVKTETINQPIELRREVVVIDRTAGSGEAAGNKALTKAFTEEETVIPLRREEAVIQKQTVSAGEIVVRTSAKTEQSSVQAQVRREDIDLSGLNSANVVVSENVKSPPPAGAASTPGGKSTGAASSSGTITDPGTLSSDDIARYSGWEVRFKEMKVQKVVSDRVITVNTGSGRPLYVVAGQPPATALRAGDSVIISGKIMRSGSVVTQSGLDDKGSQTLAQQPYYIEVQKFEMAPK
jgi:uncharacterized protein (TIGR02271 family)